MKKLLFTLFILTAFCLMLLTACTECEVCSFGDWETVTEATCTAEGEKVRICSECQKEDRQPIEKKEHDLSLKETTLAATCTTEGKETWGCANCDYTEEHTVKATGHKETKTVTAEATCSKQGTAVYTCSVCNVTREEVLPTKSHSYSPATCKKPKTCEDCGATSGEKADHTYSEATCTEPKKCTSCGKTEGKALGHNIDDGECTRCDAKSTIKITNSIPTQYKCYTNSGEHYATCEIVSITETRPNEFDILIKILFRDYYTPEIAYKIVDPSGAVVFKNTNPLGDVEEGESVRYQLGLSYKITEYPLLGEYKLTLQDRK
ncbi:MAG: hypothetical protein J6M34_05420 [Clostridia bacterium]|nr:hypothetical protein [Clostridia bacterium]